MPKWLILCGNTENWDVAIEYKIWGAKPTLRRVWNQLSSEDVVFFYVTRTIKRVIGVGRVREKLDPQTYQPKPLWPDEIRGNKVIYPYRFKIEPTYICKNPLSEGIGIEGLRVSKQMGMSRIKDREAINELHRRINLSWNVDVPTPEGALVTRAEEKKIAPPPPTARVTSTFLPLEPAISERELEDYIEKHCAVIEPGLRLVTRDYRTASRNRIDLLLQDTQNNYVILEAKTRIDRSVFGQVGEYIADIKREIAQKKGVKVRGIILSTALDEKMVNAAREFGLAIIECNLVGRKIICPKCGAKGRPGDIYCGRCGADLLYPKLTCPNCGLENIERDVYCRRCRTKLF